MIQPDQRLQAVPQKAIPYVNHAQGAANPPEVPKPQQHEVPKPKSLKCWICWLTMGHLVASFLSFVIFGTIVLCQMKSLTDDAGLLGARVEIINIDGTSSSFYGKEAVEVYFVFSTLTMMIFQIFYSCSCGCCGMTTYTRLTCSMVFLFVTAWSQAKAAAFGMMVWYDPVFYFALIMPIIHFLRHGFRNRDAYASYEGCCQCRGEEPKPQIRLHDVVELNAVVVVSPPAQPAVVPNVQPAASAPKQDGFMSDPHYEFFKTEVHQMSIAVTGSHFCDERLLENPIMFIVKKWRHHTRIFRADTHESFWKKNVETMTERVREALKLNPEPQREEPHEAA